MICDENILVVIQGDDVVLPITIEGTDITGCTVYLAINSIDNTTVVDIRQTTHTTPLSGITSITIPRATTAAMSPDVSHTGTLRMKSAGNLITTLGEFAVVVQKSISSRED